MFFFLCDFHHRQLIFRHAICVCVCLTHKSFIRSFRFRTGTWVTWFVTKLCILKQKSSLQLWLLLRQVYIFALNIWICLNVRVARSSSSNKNHNHYHYCCYFYINYIHSDCECVCVSNSASSLLFLLFCLNVDHQQQ